MFGWLSRLFYLSTWLTIAACAACLKIVSWVLKQHEASKAGEAPEAGSEKAQQPEEEPEDDGSHDYSGSVKLKPQKVQGAAGEIARILSAPEYYAVLEVARDAQTIDIKKAYRIKQMATHPDKNQGVAGAVEASQRVNAAYDTLGDEIRRRQYDVRLQDEELYGPRGARNGAGGAAGSASMSQVAKAFDEFVRSTMPPPPDGALYPTIDPSAYDPWGDAPDHTFRMACSCGYDHIAKKVKNRTGRRARWCTCSQCGMMGSWLPATNDQVWFESTNNFMRQINPERYIKAYRCCKTHVYDITDWAKCNGMLADKDGNPAPTNTHYAPFKLSSNKDQAGRQQQPKNQGSYSGGGAATGPQQRHGKKKGKNKGRRV